MILEYIKTLSQYLAPHHPLSRFAGFIANCRIPVVKNWLIKDFTRRYQVDMSSAIQSDPTAYSNFNDFFTRALKPEARPIDNEANSIVSPVDGVVSQAGIIEEGRIFQAKGFTFDLLHLLGGHAKYTQAFKDGQFATFYLSPKDYHRVHMPITGTLREMIHVPGKLFSVNPRTTSKVSGLFARNERVVCLFDTAQGPMAVILVGAMIVASINTTWANEITPPRRKQISAWQYPVVDTKSLLLQRGAEMGHFKLGSTVIVLFAPNMMQWENNLKENVTVRMGERIGTFKL